MRAAKISAIVTMVGAFSFSPLIGGSAFAEGSNLESISSESSHSGDGDASTSGAFQYSSEELGSSEESVSSGSMNDSSPYGGVFDGNSFRYSNGQPRSYSDNADRGSIQFYSAGKRMNATAFGIDVSEWQGDINWAQVKAGGVDFAIIRCGWGDGGLDSSFIKNVQGCKANGIKFGIYLYSYAWDEVSAAAEARWTLALLDKAGISSSDLSLPVYYDLEEMRNGRPAGVDNNNSIHYISTESFALMATTFCNALSAKGYQTGVYSYLNYWNTYLTDAVFNQWHRWIAQYNYQNDYAGSYSMWQYSSMGQIAGIAGNVDVNYAYNGLDSLGSWLEDNGSFYYRSGNGKTVTGEARIAGKWYYLDPGQGGRMATGFVGLPSGKTVYYGEDGAMRYGEQRIDGKWYYFSPANGAMAKGLTGLPSGKTVYYGEDGAMRYGRQTVPGKGARWFDGTTGAMVVSGWSFDNSISLYLWIDSEGAPSHLYSRVDQNGLRYLVDSNGVYLSGWQKAGVDTMYGLPDKSGLLAMGEMLISGKWYYFDSNGCMASAKFVQLSSPSAPSGKKWVYYSSDGSMLYGEQQINGGWYYLDTMSGAVTYGWKHLDKSAKWVYYGQSDGRMLYGWQTIDGVLRYFDTVTGACDKVGYQNSFPYYRVSIRKVTIPSYAQGGSIFSYITPSRISVDATRSELIETMISRAFDYLYTPYKWDYSCAPGVGVDCAGLVMQALYATGMDLSPMNPWDHYYQGLTGNWHSQYANYMWTSARFKHVPLSERQRGDLISYPGHVAIYLGNDQIIEASSPAVGVRVHSMYINSTIRGVMRPFA